MPWYLVAQFFGGVALANAVPHIAAGVAGRRFPTPFAKPPFRGRSSATVNALWGLANLAAAYALLVVVGRVELRRAADVAIAAAGFGLAAVGIVRSVRRQQGGDG